MPMEKPARVMSCFGRKYQGKGRGSRGCDSAEGVHGASCADVEELQNKGDAI